MKDARILVALAVLAFSALIGVQVAATTTPDTTNTGPAVFRDSGGDRLVVSDGGALWNGAGAGAIGVSSSGFSLAENGVAVHQTVFTLDGVELVITDHTTAGAHGSIKLYDLPAGYIDFLGSTIDLDVACGSTGLADASTYDFGIGTAAAGIDNAALATTEQNLIAKIEGDTTHGDASLGSALATDVPIDGHTTPADVYFNAVFEADDASGDDVCTLTGTVTVSWINLGDY